ncbi:MAG: type IV secretion system protein [Acidobacteriia bacterium]|nr:type IV secretion system protein [Terriglobia bacterium]
MPPSTMNDLFAFLSQLMTEHAALFETMGSHMFKAFAVILISWFGVKSALASASGGMVPALHYDQLAGLLMTIAFGFGMITYYSHPIPGFGVSFYHLVIDQGLDLSNQLNHSIVQDLWDRLTNLYWGMETPGLTIALNILEILRYAITILCIVAAQAAVFAVIAFGYVAAAIAVMLGPIFIPFFIVPHMEWLFWGWLKSLIQYAFYPVVANAYVFVFGNLLIHFIDAHQPPYDGATILLLFFPLVLLLIAFTFGILKIPSLVNSLFTGRSGESAIPLL